MISLVALALVREDFAPTWNQVAQAIRSNYYARNARKGEMEGLLSRYALQAKSATSREGFRDAVNAMIREFHDSHFEMTTDGDMGYYLAAALMEGPHAPTMPQVGAWFRRDPDGYTVQMVLDGGAAERAGLRVGDQIRTVDGKPFSPVEALAGDVGRTATLGYVRNGAPGEATVAVTRTNALAMFLDATKASERILERGGKRLGYLHLWTQASGDFQKELRDALQGRFKNTDGFVLDLRGGFGGYPSGYEPLLRSYGKPVVAIIDHGSRSAKEMLSFRLQKDGVATLVGQTTAGNVLGTLPMRLNAWSYLEIPMMDFQVDGVRLEGRGVSPDVPVPEGGDPVETAITVLTARRV